MKLSEFRYIAPKSNIAKFPADPRDSAKMMVLNKATGEMEDKTFRDIMDYFQKGDCIVVNETRVFPARVFGKKEKTNAKIGNKIYFDNNKFYCEVVDNTTNRGRTVRFSYDGDLFKVIERIGEMPLPAYIKRDPTEHDKETYQCVFANPNKTASIAPPTAGVHFTQKMLKELEAKGVRIATVSLNIGQGIFENIEVEDLTKHRMYSEYFEITKDNADTINKSLKSKKNVYAVGCSVARALEASVLTTGAVKPNKGWTDKFIYPPYEFKIANRFITNFHPPATPSILLSAAFAGKELLFKAYKRAIKSDYRLFAYGDAMLIINE